jgi:hypothetical protein
MRSFWILLALLSLAGIAYSLNSILSGPPRAAPAPMMTPEVAPPPPTVPTPAPAPKPEPTPAPKAQAKPEPVAKRPEAPVAAPAPVPQPAPQPTPQPAPQAPVKTEPAKPEPAAQPPTPAPKPTEPAKTGAISAPATPTDAAAKIGAYEILPGKVEKKEDGTTLLDGTYTIKGEGTKEKPYEITWDLLTSVDQDFDPHAGKKKLPQRIAFLHDTYVKLSGYIAFPMNMQQPKELLLMLNQWDGCCIGVPPTPYDAIEVSLNKTVVGDDRFATTGAVVGKMSIKPYVVGDWLVGLYVMDLGEFSPKFGGGGSN